MSNARGSPPGCANAQPRGRNKIANAPPPGLTTKQMPHGCPGGGWAPLELTDALQCMALFPCNRFPWKFHKQVGGRHLLQLVFLPLQYSNKPPACNKYIANIIAAQLSFVLANQRRVSSIIFRHEKGIEIIGESCNDAVARSIVGKQLPPGTLEEEKPRFLQNSQNKQVYAPF